MSNNNNNFDWNLKTWNIIDAIFKDKRVLVQHHLDSFNSFIDINLHEIIKEHNPIIINSTEESNNKPIYKYVIEFSEIYLSKPVINENDGTIKPMYPCEAILRNLTYSSNLYCDIKHKLLVLNDKKTEYNEEILQELSKFNIGKIPIMLNSKFCVLSEQSNKTRQEMGNGEFEEGGYFIINGSEKVIVCQERKCENKIFTFEQTKSLSKYSNIAEITCINYKKSSQAITVQVKLTSKEDTSFNGRLIKVQIRKFKQDIPLFVVFRALGILSEKSIIELIVNDIDDTKNKAYIELLKPSLEEGFPIQSKKVALEYLSRYIPSLNYRNYKKNTDDDDCKLKYTYDILIDELFPHIGDSSIKKTYYLGLMVKKLLNNYLNISEPDNRDSFINKRVETTGELFKILFRNNFNKFIKDIKLAVEKDFRSGRIDDLKISLAKKIKGSTIETGLKYALSTGNWGLKSNTGKKGIAQLLQRITYLSTISNLRRIVSPMDRSMKALQPRALQNSHYGYLCPLETPEGSPVGIVKNMALTTHITTYNDPIAILSALEEYGMLTLEEIKPLDVSLYVKIFVNGDWLGLHKEPNILTNKLKNLRRNGTIPIYTSISWKIIDMEIHILSDGGRLTRPMYIVNDNKLSITNEFADKFKSDNKLSINDLITNLNDNNLDNNTSIIEYIDTQESDMCMFATTYQDLINNKKENESFYKYTHCELHPSMILGALVCNIPFPECNQAPRNLFQAAMGKQAIGIYATNFRLRMDTLGHILHYTQKPLVSTRPSYYVNTNKLPAGQNIIVAIACYTGYNQEDSLIVNQNAIDRGLFNSSYFRTHKDEEKKNQSTLEEEKFCKPEQYYPNGELKTEKMKFESYENLEENGFIKEGSVVKGNDIIIGKVIPLKNNEDGPKFRDASTTTRANESGVVDKVYVNKNADGYRFCKVRIRSDRIPQIGDKFASRHGQKGTIGIIYNQEDMPFTKNGIVPDIIVNSHAIPSRMTIAQLIECILGKISSIKGVESDATPFNGVDADKISELLEKKCNLHKSGKEILYDGRSGEQIESEIFIGPTHYYRLKHLVEDKVHSRSTGPYQLLTRQPAEGRSRDGGLRFGEMERDCMLAHGTVQFLKERMFDNSDKYVCYTCKKCGVIAIANPIENIFECKYCKNTNEFAQIQIPYASKLFIQELMSMSIMPRIITN